MIYLIKDECGDIYGAVANVGEHEVQKAQSDIERAIREASKRIAAEIQKGPLVSRATPDPYEPAANALGLKCGDNKAQMLHDLLIKRGGADVQFTVWRAGL